MPNDYVLFALYLCVIFIFVFKFLPMPLKDRIRKLSKPFERQMLVNLRRVTELDAGVELQYLTGLARLEFFHPGIVRIQLSRSPCPAEKISDTVIAKPGDEFQIEQKPDQMIISTDLLKLIIPEGAFRFEIYDRAEKLLSRDFPNLGPGFGDRDFALSRFIFPDEEFFGLGDKYGPLNRKGKVWIFWNQDVGSRHFERDPRYTSIPFLISTRPGAITGWFFDHPGFLQIDLGKKYPGLMSVSGVGDSLDCYFFYGASIKELLSLFTELTGRAPIPPIWSLGYHQSRYSYFSQDEVLKIAEEFRNRGIPLSAIHLDIHYMDRYQPFTIDQKRFPSLAELARKLADMGIRLVSIIDPGLKVSKNYAPYLEAQSKGYLCVDEKGKEYHRKLWPGESAFPDFFRKDVQEFWAEQHKILFEKGISGIWDDMNEPSFWKRDLRLGKLVVSFQAERYPEMVHQVYDSKVKHLECRNLYGQKELEATVLAFKKFQPGKRPFILSRSGFAGIQKLCAVWTGDSRSCFQHLAGSIKQILSWGLSGVSFSGADIGGFAKDCSPELYARWIQLGAFYPFCRTHSCIGTKPQEPYQFGREVEDIAREYIRLRYRFLPTLYSLFWESSQTGIPIWRPLFLEFPDDFVVKEIEDQFMVGEFLLLAPVLKRKARERRLYLPEGRWIDFWDKKQYSGPGWIKVPAELRRMPIFVRESAILALQANADLRIPWQELEFEIYPGERSGRFQLYEDDGESQDYLNGEFSLREFQISRTNEGFKLSIGPKQGLFPIQARQVKLRFYALNSEPRVILDGRAMENAHWHPEKNLLEMEFILKDAALEICIAANFLDTI